MNRKLKVNVKETRAKTVGASQRPVALDEGNSGRPRTGDGSRSVPSGPAASQVEVISGKERLLLSADKEIVLRCGSASISLLADGTVVLKGTRLVSSSTGLNRMRGAAVKIN